MPELRQQSVRVMAVNTAVLAAKRDLIVRFLRGYRDTVDWMYTSDEAAERYSKIVGSTVAQARRTREEFIKKEDLNPDRVEGLDLRGPLRLDVHLGAGTLGRMQIKTTGGSAGQRLNAGFDIAVDDVALTTMSPDTALFLPHQMRIRSAVAGLPVAQVLALLQAAIAANANPALLQQQATELLRQPGAQAAIESIDFDSGPLHLHGSARFVPRPDGKVGASIHLVASGADALLAKAQGKPALQGILPMVFLAKGLGRADGNSIVWDIDLGGGPPVINGMPFGQPSPARR